MRAVDSQLQSMLQQAIQAFQSGNFDGADSILKTVLQVDPKNLLALNVLGLIKASETKYTEAANFFGRAARISPNDASIQFNLAKALTDSGNDKDAITHHKKAVALDPNNQEAWLSYGITTSNLGRYEDALVYYGNALRLKPDYSEALLSKGNVFYALKRYDEAILCYDQALALNPHYPEAWTNKGITLHELKQYDGAIIHYDKALSLKPDYHETWNNKGVTLHELKQYDGAIIHYDKALSLKPDYAEAYCNKGATLNDLKRYDEAIAHYDKALSLKPDYAEAWTNKGVTLNDLKRYEEAIAHYDKALSLKSDYHEAWSNKGVTLNDLKRYEEAIAHYDKALSLKPDINWISGDLLHAKMKICSWSGLAESLEDISKKVLANERVVNPFVLLALNDDACLHKQCSEIYAQDRYPENSTLDPIPKAAKKEKIRIAYFSPDFRNHAVSLLTSELFEIHDRSRFEVFAFSLQKAPIDDEINIRLRKGFDRFIEVDNMSDLKIAQLARELKVDIAIDLAGPTQYSRTRIFSYRAAPIQLNWLGYPGTIGADFIDYIMADKTIIPEQHQQFYTEKVVTLPNTYMVDDSKRTSSSRVFTREECGLQENAFVFCCFNNDYKFNPKVLDCWSRILLAAKNSILWISENNESFRANIIIEFDKQGISSNRIIFAQRVALMADHLSRYAMADLFLDTHPYNAHTTALDSLKAGVPVLTLKGQSFASRVAASLLNAIGLPELITSTQEEYEVLAIELATNPHKLADIKLKLAKNRLTTPLFDTPLFTKNLEVAYSKMYERYQDDLQPDHITII
jgi:predicted O-linked N-acetylglucosamine transferase (SPINDLY family)